MKFLFAFNFTIQQTFMPVEKQETYIKQGYLPLLDVLERHPKAKAAFFFDGFTERLINKKYPDMIKRVKKGMTQKRYEIGTYTYTHPVLSLIPFEDTYRQIEKGLQIDKEILGIRPKGTILPESGWDPSIAKIFKDLNLEWVIMGPNPFIRENPKASISDLYKPYILEGIFNSQVKVMFTDEKVFNELIPPNKKDSVYYWDLPNMDVNNWILHHMKVQDQGAKFFIAKQDAEFIYLSTWQNTEAKCGEELDITNSVNKFDKFVGELVKKFEFCLPEEFLLNNPPKEKVFLRPSLISGLGFNYDEWLRGSEKVGYLIDEARMEIKIAKNVIDLAEKIGLGVKKAKEDLEIAWDRLMEAEISVGRRACNHKWGQYSRVYLSIERAWQARELAVKAVKRIDNLDKTKKHDC